MHLWAHLYLLSLNPCRALSLLAGHADPRWQEAVTEQAATLAHVSNLFHTVPQVGVGASSSGCCGCSDLARRGQLQVLAVADSVDVPGAQAAAVHAEPRQCAPAPVPISTPCRPSVLLPKVKLAKRLVEASFADRVFYANTGTEANEAAIKFARKYAKVQGECPSSLVFLVIWLVVSRKEGTS